MIMINSESCGHVSDQVRVSDLPQALAVNTCRRRDSDSVSCRCTATVAQIRVRKSGLNLRSESDSDRHVISDLDMLSSDRRRGHH